MTTPIWIPRINVKLNEKLISIKAMSGFRMRLFDPASKEILMEPSVSDFELGMAVRESMSQSRFLSFEESEILYMKASNDHEFWVKKLMAIYGYKTRRALFKNMKNCGVEHCNKQIKISPTHHSKLEGWGREKDDGIEDVIIPDNSTYEEVGAALRLAFTRCTG